TPACTCRTRGRQSRGRSERPAGPIPESRKSMKLNSVRRNPSSTSSAPSSLADRRCLLASRRSGSAQCSGNRRLAYAGRVDGVRSGVSTGVPWMCTRHRWNAAAEAGRSPKPAGVLTIGGPGAVRLTNVGKECTGCAPRTHTFEGDGVTDGTVGVVGSGTLAGGTRLPTGGTRIERRRRGRCDQRTRTLRKEDTENAESPRGFDVGRGPGRGSPCRGPRCARGARHREVPGGEGEGGGQEDLREGELPGEGAQEEHRYRPSLPAEGRREVHQGDRKGRLHRDVQRDGQRHRGRRRHLRRR